MTTKRLSSEESTLERSSILSEEINWSSKFTNPLSIAHDIYTLDEEDLNRALACQVAGVKVALMCPSRRLVPSAGREATRRESPGRESTLKKATQTSIDAAMSQGLGVSDISQD